MRGFGILLLLGGCAGLLWALNLDTSVSTGFGSVNNIGLMQDKQNYLILSAVAAFAGLILTAINTPKVAKSEDPFDQLSASKNEQDREALNERKRYAITLGITRQHGAYYSGKARYLDIEEAIRDAEARKTEAEV